MAFRRLVISALTAGLIVSTFSAARADSVFLLQLGSFPSEQEANQRWNDLKGKHSDILSGLALRIAQVALPPDNTVIYRTQAGPVESREDASKMCQKLASTKDECFVVETAMFIGDEDVAAIAPAPSKSDTTPPAPALLPSPGDTAMKSLPEALPAPAPDVNLPDVPPAPLSSQPEAAPLPPLASDLPPPPESLPETAVPAPAPEPAVTSLPEPVELVAETPEPKGKKAEKKEPKKEPKKTAEPSIKKPVKRAKVASGKKGKDEPVLATPSIDYENKAIRTEKPGYLPDLSAQPVESAVQQSSTPAFLMDQNAASANNVPRELVEAAPPVNADAPANVTINVPPQQPTKSSDNVAYTTGVQVNVSEAIRVPLSNAQNAPASPPPPRIVTREPGVGGYPSYNPNFRTLWAQISYFPDQQTALAFWDDYRYANSESTRAVRVRVTQPYYYSSRNSTRVSLRMGPFASMEDVQNVCAAASSKELECSLVKDIGSSASATVGRDRVTYRGYEEAAHMQKWNMAPDAPANWIQLGSYPTPEQAWNAWDGFKRDHVDLLGKIGADVNTANMSSASKQVFRLRVGPFMTKMAARLLCERLEYRGVSCVVVGKR